jgi:hypothetical protein
MPDSSESGAPGDRPNPDGATREVRDAEQLAEEWAERAGRWLLRTAARMREEAEDIWHEAQAVRRDL